MNTIQELYQVVLNRKEFPEGNSYTCYLFNAGLDKILKKCGEETAEVIIAAKNAKAGASTGNHELKNEIADLIYHILVLCADRGLDWSEVEQVLHERSLKIGNLKEFKQTDKDT